MFFDITTSSGGIPDPASWVGFNPQPEPPAFPAGAGLIGFDFDFTSMSVATLRFQILNNQGQAISFAVVPAVPEPTTFILFGAGCALLASVHYHLRRKKRA